MERIAIKKELLHWALNRSGLTVEALEHKFPKIRHWTTGDILPTLRQLETLAKVTRTPLGWFFLSEPPKEQLPIPYYRTHVDTHGIKPSLDLLESIQIMQRRQAWMRELLIEEGQVQLNYVHSARISEPPPVVAEKIRHVLGLGEGWASRRPTWSDALLYLRGKMEVSGILVASNGVVGNNTHRKLNPEEFRGFVLVDQYAPLVFVNGADGKAAQMFTLAHELAHVIFGSSAAFDLREMQPATVPIEQACNFAAAEFLVPESELRLYWPSVQLLPEPFQAIAQRFKVSVLVAARRALDLNLIRKESFLDFYQAYQQEERQRVFRGQPGGDFYSSQNLRIGKRFARSVIQAARKGNLLYSEAYRLTGLYGKTFDRYADSLDVEGS